MTRDDNANTNNNNNNNNKQQKADALCTAHRVRKVLLKSTETFIMGNSVTCTINCNYKKAKLLYPTNTICFRHVIQIPCIKMMTNIIIIIIIIMLQ